MIPQVKKEHYFKRKYNTLSRFISYFYQIDLIIQSLESQDQRVLEIGVGNGLVSNYLRQAGFKITTCDFDESLKPDYTADVRRLPFADNSFDLVAAFEILEHMPFDDLPKALSELKRAASNKAIISLPYRSTSLELAVRFPLIRTIFKKDFLNLFLRIPLFFKGIKSSGQHYWEIDSRNYRLSKIKRILKRYFRRITLIKPVLDAFHLFFILEK